MTTKGLMIRAGIGYDVHRFGEGRRLILGGVDVPFTKGLVGHSDADVLCHAIADALLGAAALGDIGMHFPDTESRYKNISSITLLKHVKDMLQKENCRINNVDSTIVIERPKMAPHILTMRKNIAGALGVEISSVSVKATTSEGMGFTGTGEGAAAYAVVSVEQLPEAGPQ